MLLLTHFFGAGVISWSGE